MPWSREIYLQQINEQRVKRGLLPLDERLNEIQPPKPVEKIRKVKSRRTTEAAKTAAPEPQPAEVPV